MDYLIELLLYLSALSALSAVLVVFGFFFISIIFTSITVGIGIPFLLNRVGDRKHPFILTKNENLILNCLVFLLLWNTVLSIWNTQNERPIVHFLPSIAQKFPEHQSCLAETNRHKVLTYADLESCKNQEQKLSEKEKNSGLQKQQQEILNRSPSKETP